MFMKNRGQAFVEFVLGFWLFSFVVVALIFLTQMSLVKLAALESAQLGTDLQASTNLSAGEIKNILMEQLEWKGLAQKFNWSVALDPPAGSPSFRFYHLAQTRVKVRLKGPFTIEEVVAAEKNP